MTRSSACSLSDQLVEFPSSNQCQVVCNASEPVSLRYCFEVLVFVLACGCAAQPPPEPEPQRVQPAHSASLDAPRPSESAPPPEEKASVPVEEPKRAEPPAPPETLESRLARLREEGFGVAAELIASRVAQSRQKMKLEPEQGFALAGAARELYPVRAFPSTPRASKGSSRSRAS